MPNEDEHSPLRHAPVFRADPMPVEVALAASIFGTRANWSVIQFLQGIDIADLSMIWEAVNDGDVQVSKRSLQIYIEQLEAAGVVTGDRPLDDRGKGKKVRYVLNDDRVRELIRNQTLYLLGTTSPSEEDHGAAGAGASGGLGVSESRVLNYLSKRMSATVAEVAAATGLPDDEIVERLDELTNLGFVSRVPGSDTYEIDRLRLVYYMVHVGNFRTA